MLIIAAYFLAEMSSKSFKSHTNNNYIVSSEQKKIESSQHILEQTRNKNLFNAQRGVVGNKKTQQEASKSIPISSLTWKLLGTIRNSNVNESVAILSVNGKTKNYKTDAQVEGWRIANIERESIILAQGSKTERLLLRKNSQKKNVDRKITVNKSKLLASFANPAELLSIISLNPVQENNIRGLKINSIDNSTELGKLQLQAQDILVMIDENALQSFESLKHFKELQQKKSFLLTFVRNNAVLTYNYTMQ